MPNDAKLGLVVGMGLTIAAAVVFFAKEPGIAGAPPPSHIPEPRTDAWAATNQSSLTPAQVTSRSSHDAGVEYTIAPGDTLASIAQRHYGDAGRFIDIYQANRHRLPNPDRLPVGEKLRLP